MLRRLKLVCVWVVFVLSSVATMGFALAFLIGVSIGHSDFDCPDPLRPPHESGGPFGEEHWRWFPPEYYCDYSSLHPEWPDELAIDPEPSLSKGWLLLLAPTAALMSGSELVQAALARHRRSHPPRPNLNLPPAQPWDHATTDP